MSKWGKWGTEMFPQLWKFGTKGINKNLLQFVTPLYQGLNFLNLISSCFLRNFLQLTHPIVKTELLSILTKKNVPYLYQERTKKLYLSQVLLDFRHGLTKKIVLDFCKDLKKTKIVLDFHQERWSTWLDLWDLLWGDVRSRRHKLQYWRDFKYRGNTFKRPPRCSEKYFGSADANSFPWIEATQVVFSCPEQLNRWPCHWLTHSLRTLLIDIQKTIELSSDLPDIWSEWWRNVSWLTERQTQWQRESHNTTEWT